MLNFARKKVKIWIGKVCSHKSNQELDSKNKTSAKIPANENTSVFNCSIKPVSCKHLGRGGGREPSPRTRRRHFDF